jgi:hypothetical protein
MTTDATKPLSPLDPGTIAHLTEQLGPAERHLLAVSSGRDVYTDGWTIGLGQIAGGGQNSSRGTDVEIVLTAGGNLVTTRRSWTRSPDGNESGASATGAVHQTPASAYRWLINDGKGKLGPASKAAWLQACRTLPLMAGLEFEHVE